VLCLQCFFAATGVSDGDLVRGVRFFSGGASTNSVVMRGKSQTGAVRVGGLELNKQQYVRAVAVLTATYGMQHECTAAVAQCATVLPHCLQDHCGVAVLVPCSRMCRSDTSASRCCCCCCSALH
jgi:hypothetical protein